RRGVPRWRMAGEARTGIGNHEGRRRHANLRRITVGAEADAIFDDGAALMAGMAHEGKLMQNRIERKKRNAKRFAREWSEGSHPRQASRDPNDKQMRVAA